MAYVLLTGATGNLGSVILEQLLPAGHKVNAVIRSFAKAKSSLTKQYQSAVDSGQLIFTEIPDMAAPDVFHEPARGASAIFHAATPLEYDDFLETVIKPISLITKNVLNAAAAAPNVKRLIVTGSIVSTIKVPNDLYGGKTISENDWSPVTLEEAESNVYDAYTYSKVTSEKEAWEFMRNNKPKFDLIYLLAPSITGKSIQIGAKLSKRHLGGTAGFYSELVDTKEPGHLFPYFMDVEDVAAVHVKSLSPSVPGNERYLFHAQGILLGDAVANFVRDSVPELKDRVPAGREDAQVPSSILKTDTSKAEKVFGSEWKSWQDTVLEMSKDVLQFEREGLIEE